MTMADNDNDFRPFGVNLSTMGRFGGAGLLGGSSAAAALVLVRMLKDLSEERKALTQPTEEEQNTITLTLPKRAEADCSAGADCAGGAVVAPAARNPSFVKKLRTDKSEDIKRVTEIFKVKADHPRTGVKAMTTPKQIRSTDGKYNVKMANWQTLAASLLALGAGGALGYTLVNKVYDMKKKRELQAKVDAAKQEYLDQLQGTTKQAGLFGGGREGDPSFSLLDYPGGLGAVALLLGGGSTAWITKRILDEYNKGPENKYKPGHTPHIERIVFKSEGSGQLPSMQRAEEDQVKESSDNSAQDVAEASLGIYLDLMSGQARILGDVDCGAELIKSGSNPEEMYKMASEDYDRLVQYLKQNPGLRSTIKRLAMDKHPILKYFKWTSDLPLIKAYGDNKLYESTARRYGPTSDVWDAARTGQLEQKFGSVKDANMGIPSMLGNAGAGTTGAVLASLAFEKAKEEERAAQPVELTPEQQKAKVEQIVQHIQLGAKDPRSLAFVQQNSEKIRNILLLLAQEGKL